MSSFRMSATNLIQFAICCQAFESSSRAEHQDGVQWPERGWNGTAAPSLRDARNCPRANCVFFLNFPQTGLQLLILPANDSSSVRGYIKSRGQKILPPRVTLRMVQQGHKGWKRKKKKKKKKNGERLEFGIYWTLGSRSRKRNPMVNLVRKQRNKPFPIIPR